MARKVLVFGNGLGMALSEQDFSIENSLDTVWHDDDLLSEPQRELIRACLPSNTELNRPSSEDDLDQLQRVLAACDQLNAVQLAGDNHWLTEHGQEFPSAIRKFVHKVACRFHQSELRLPDAFVQPLCRFISETKSHVATLNYDDLLYQPMIDAGVLRGYSGNLIDGLTNTGFQRQNLHRLHPNSLGWYLHLHGSPLFFDGNNGRVMKMPRNQLGHNQAMESTHLVLTHVRHKPTIIGASTLLSAYWDYFERALAEAEEICVMGYSGFDSHLNLLLQRFAEEIPVRVIEWEGAAPDVNRLDYWRSKVGNVADLVRMESILEFDAW